MLDLVSSVLSICAYPHFCALTLVNVLGFLLNLNFNKGQCRRYPIENNFICITRLEEYTNLYTFVYGR